MGSQWERLLKSQGYLQNLIWWISSRAVMNRKALINPVSERHLQCTTHSNSPSKPLNWQEGHSLLDGIPCRKNSFRSLLHLITRHQLGSGLQLRTWLTNKDVSFTSNWPNGMVRRRAFNPSAFTARHVQQRQLQNKKQKKLLFTARTKISIEMLSTAKQKFTSACSCKSAKWICSFFSKKKFPLEFSGSEIITQPLEPLWFAGADQDEASLRFAPAPVCLCLSARTKDSLQQWQQRIVLLPMQKNTVT